MTEQMIPAPVIEELAKKWLAEGLPQYPAEELLKLVISPYCAPEDAPDDRLFIVRVHGKGEIKAWRSAFYEKSAWTLADGSVKKDEYVTVLRPYKGEQSSHKLLNRGLFGLWATTASGQYGVVVSEYPNENGFLKVELSSYGSYGRQFSTELRLDLLTFDPIPANRISAAEKACDQEDSTDEDWDKLEALRAAKAKEATW